MSNPIVPFTLDGASVLHQMFHVRWEEWRALDQHSRQALVDEAATWLASKEAAEGGEQSAAFAMLGHKGDLMLLHYRRDFVGLLEAQAQVRKLRISEYLECSNSYLSVVELGLYESTRKIHDEFAERGLTPGTEEWEKAATETLDRQKKAMSGRLWPEIPSARYLCFYPMDRKRGELKNWFSEDFGDRQKMMHEHGMIGRKYGGVVKQIISGSIGFDDWEWGVDLFAESPLPFKQLIYEMRFDKVSAEFALFGPFYMALRIVPGGLTAFMKDDARSAVE